VLREWLVRFINSLRYLFSFEAYREQSVCETCEFLKIELEKERAEKKELLAAILAQLQVKEPERLEGPIPEAVPGRYIPWILRRQQLEAADREQARKLKLELDSQKTTEELEREVLDEPVGQVSS
jgi:hypothetical protein